MATSRHRKSKRHSPSKGKSHHHKIHKNILNVEKSHSLRKSAMKHSHKKNGENLQSSCYIICGVNVQSPSQEKGKKSKEQIEKAQAEAKKCTIHFPVDIALTKSQMENKEDYEKEMTRRTEEIKKVPGFTSLSENGKKSKSNFCNSCCVFDNKSWICKPNGADSCANPEFSTEFFDDLYGKVKVSNFNEKENAE